jgi:hypothetical protein
MQNKTLDVIQSAENIVNIVKDTKDTHLTDDQLELVSKALYMARCEIVELKFHLNVQSDS